MYVRYVYSTLAFSLSSHRLIHKFCLYLSFSRFIINNFVSQGTNDSSVEGKRVWHTFQQETVSLSFPQFNRLIEASFTQQILSHWYPFKHLKQSNLHSQQLVVVTVEDSVLRTEMSDIESQEEDAPPWTVKPILTLASSTYCRGLCTSDRDGWHRVSRRGCPQSYPLL